MCGNTERRFAGGQDGAGAENRGLAAGPGSFHASAMSACSACAGDYEDPDRTAWPTEEERVEAEEEEPASEFPDRDPDQKN